MSDYLPKEVRAGLELARKNDRRKKNRLRLKFGKQTFTILRYWDRGIALDAQDAPHVRGLVDVYDGARYLSQCLIVASSEEAGEMIYEFKRETRATGVAPSDYAVDDAAPLALIGRE